jgi:ElaB/YqjD/DUF883 family membrane-anchored ribosome-binding protein
LKKEDTAAGYYQPGRQQAEDYYQPGRQQAEDYYQPGRQQAEDYYQPGRQQVAAVENALEDAMRTKPLQSILIAAGFGMLLTLLLKK